eukprot:scaffold147569_cov29-Tisochrysis_lutea.AAC.3
MITNSNLNPVPSILYLVSSFVPDSLRTCSRYSILRAASTNATTTTYVCSNKMGARRAWRGDAERRMRAKGKSAFDAFPVVGSRLVANSLALQIEL